MPTPPPPATARPPRNPVALALLWVTGLLVVLVAAAWWRVPRIDPPDTASPLYRINVNTARSYELALLPDIGPAKAAAIVDERQARGAFTGPDDLQRVDGIAATIARRVSPHVCFE